MWSTMRGLTSQMLSLLLGTILAREGYALGTDFWPYQSFVTEPTFHPPIFSIEKSGQQLAEGLIVFTPAVEINSSDPVLGARELASSMLMTDNGELVWNGPIEASTNLFVQTLNGEPVLSRWNGIGSNVGHGYGQVTILDTNYQTLYNVCPKLNLVKPSILPLTPCEADLHESFITDRGTIIVTAVNITQADLTSVNGPADGWIYDDLFFEIDIPSGEILFRWSALEHGIPLNETKAVPGSATGTGTSQSDPFDWFHMNAVQAVGNGYLANSRHCWTTYMLDSEGNVEWYLDGKTGGDFDLPEEAQFQWQHHARVQNVTIDSVHLHYFNNYNSGWDNGTHPSEGLQLLVNLTDHNVSILNNFQDPDDSVYTDSQGSYWPLENGNTLVGYGCIAKIKEYGPEDGDVRMTLQFGAENLVQSFRAYRQEWHATPTGYPPKAAGLNGTAYMSWNGATDITTWKIYTGVLPGQLNFTDSVHKDGFETAAKISSGARFLQVAAYASGELLGKSDIVPVL